MAGTRAVAQDAPMTETKSVDMTKTDKVSMGWKYSASAIAGFNVLEKKDVVGQTNGQTNVYSLKLKAGLNHFTGNTEWKNSLSIDELFSKTPSLDRVVKTGDEVKLLSFYKYFFSNNSPIGVYARSSAESSLLDTYDEHQDDVTYVIAKRDGTIKTETDDRYKTSTSFQPMTTKESTGLIVKILSHPLYTLEGRTGFGAKQFFTKGASSVKDDKDTPEIEVYALSDTRVAGIEVAAELNGADEEKKFIYLVYAEGLYPISYSPKGDSDPDKSKLISTEVGVDLTYAMLDWMGISYTGKSKREPQTQAKSQVTHSFFLTLTAATGN